MPSGQCCMPERKLALYAATGQQAELLRCNTDYSMARVIRTPAAAPASLDAVIVGGNFECPWRLTQ